jgi:hypothetical protein
MILLTSILAGSLGSLPGSVCAQSAESGSDELSRQATDPTASLMSFGFIPSYTDLHGDIPGEPDHAWEFKFQPVIPFQAFGLNNILRISLPYQLEGPGDEGLQDIAVFNLTVFSEPWGRWGVGPVMSLSTDDNAPDPFAIGPALGFVYNVNKRLNMGLFSQNLFAEHTAISQLQPIAAYQLGDGWSLSLGDLQFVYDWKDSRWLSAPIGAQLGKVTQIAGQPIRFALNPQYNFIDETGFPGLKVSFSATLLFPGK